jgi:hypothetical protein
MSITVLSLAASFIKTHRRPKGRAERPSIHQRPRPTASCAAEYRGLSAVNGARLSIADALAMPGEDIAFEAPRATICSRPADLG